MAADWLERLSAPADTLERVAMLPARPALRSPPKPVEFHPEAYRGAPDEPIEANPLSPADLLTMFGSAPATALPKAGKQILPWLLRASPRGAAMVGAFGVGSDLAEGDNPLPNLPGNVAAGAVLGPAFEAGLGAAGDAGRGIARRLTPKARPRPIAATAPRAATQTIPTPITVAGLPQIEAAPAPSAAPVPRQSLTGKNAQQMPGLEDVVAEIKADPNYLRRINELGGGRVVSNQETVAKAMEAGPLSIDEIAAHRAGTPVNEVDVTRGLITADWYRQKFLEAMRTGNEVGARGAAGALKRMLPGLENMRATPGRATQVQALFVQDKITKTFEELADLQAKGVPFEQMQAAARQKIGALARDQKLRAAGEAASNWIGALEEYATRAKLTSPVTHAINTVSNALTWLPRGAIFRPIKAGVQALQGNPAGAEATMKTLFGTSSGFKSGARKYLSVLMEDATEAGKSEMRKTHFEFPRRLRPLDPFRQLAAADAFWKAIYRDSKIYEMAYTSARRQATREGLSPKRMAQRITDLVADPPTSWANKAEAEALEHTFQSEPDKILKSLGAVQNIPGMRLLIPFLKTPYNLMKYQFERSPAGIASPRNIRGLLQGGEQQAEAASRLLGGAGIAIAATMIAKRGEVTGAYPSEPGERALWEAEGRPAYSIKIGDRWLQYNRFQPLGQYLAQAAALEDAMQVNDKEGAGALFTSLMASSGKAMLDMPFLQGMSSVMDALDDPKRYGQRLLSGTLTGLIPNVLRDVRQQTDLTRREARGVGPSILNMIPGASQHLPEKVDVLGRTAGMAGNPLQRATKVVQDSRATAETEALRTSGYRPSEPQSRIQPRGLPPVKLEGKQREQFEKEMGEATRAAIARVSGYEGFKALDQETQQERQERAVNEARTRVRNRWKQAQVNRARERKEASR